MIVATITLAPTTRRHARDTASTRMSTRVTTAGGTSRAHVVSGSIDQLDVNFGVDVDYPKQQFPNEPTQGTSS